MTSYTGRDEDLNKGKIYSALLQIINAEQIRIDEPMSAHTSFKIGGPADFYIAPENTGELQNILAVCRELEFPFYVIGRGTNLLVKDKGIRGVVVSTADRMKSFSIDGNRITAQSGALLAAISNKAMENGLAGFEFASGIPGTIGGAVVMNAGAYEGQMDRVVFRSVALDEAGSLMELNNEEHKFGYRESIFQSNSWVILNVTIELEQGDRDEIKEKMDDFNNRRRDKQPLNLPSAGSVFRRVKGHYTGQLIEECGLKGYRIGGAMVSDKHCGFIVNCGGATASDVIGLINYVQEKVLSQKGIHIIPEVKVIGED
jgi:UDP-N-acetylmuramate dehydrogenase